MVKLLNGETICEKCKGSGLTTGTLRKYEKSGWRPTLIACPYCFATGKWDWVDVIKGEKSEDPDATQSMWFWNNHKEQHEKGIEQLKEMEELLHYTFR